MEKLYLKIAQLSLRTGVPISSIKYYIREGLLKRGEKLNRTSCYYHQEHVDRLLELKK